MNIRYIMSIGLVWGSIFFIHNVSAYEATYYSDAFEGGKTANGSLFSQSTHSAAICGEELGNYAYVQKGQTGMVVSLNDRPNCSRENDIIDLSSSAFQNFSPLSSGRISDVSVSSIGVNQNNFLKKTFQSDVFSSLGVKEVTPLSNTYFAGDTILIEGSVSDKKEYVMVYLESEKEKVEYSSLMPVEKNGRFKFPFTLPKIPGKYYFVVASGNSFQTTKPETITLVDPSSLTYPDIGTGSLSFRPVLAGTTTPYITLPPKTWGILTLNQGGKKYRTSGTVLVSPTSEMQTGIAKVSMSGFGLSTPSSLDRSVQYGEFWSGSVILDRTHDTTGKNKVNVRNKKGSFIFQFRVGLGEKIRGKYYVTSPNGEVHEYSFSSKYIGEDGLLVQGSNVLSSFSAREPGAYKLETVLENGYAYFNVPVYQGSVWSVISLFSDTEKLLVEKNVSQAEKYVLNRMNTLRASLGRKNLTIDSNLTQIAQAKAENMASNNYIGHWTPEGLDILDFATQVNIAHPNTLSENVAGGNVSYMILQDGLEESGSHRHSMINQQWKKVGIGYSIKNKKGYLVQVFSE